MPETPLAARDRRARRIIFSLSFFKEHIGFSIVLVVGALFGLLLIMPMVDAEFLTHFAGGLGSFLNSPAKGPINALIFWVTFFGGMTTAAIVLARVHREVLILTLSKIKIDLAKEHWAKEARLSWPLEDGLGAILPSGAGEVEEPKESTAGRMIEAMLADAKDLRFDPIPIVVERVITDLDNGSQSVRVWQGYAVRVGILFTFVGLVIALAPVRNVLATPPPSSEDAVLLLTWLRELRGSIGDVVNGLALAFGSSIAGLVSALLLQLVVSMVQRREVTVVELLASIAADVQYLFRRARNETPLARDIEAVRTLLVQHKDELHASSRAFDSSIAAIDSKLDGIGNARDSMTALLAQQTQATDRHTKLVGDLASSEARLGQLAQESAVRLTELLGKTEGSLVELVGRSETYLTDLVSKSILEVAQRQVESSESLVAAVKKMGASLIEEINEGYGREARVALEQRVGDILVTALGSLEANENRHVLAAERVAQNLSRALGYVLILVFAAAVAFLIMQLWTSRQ